MHWIKKAVFGMCFTFFLFIFFSFLDVGGSGIFGSNFLTISGFILIICMGAVETSVVFYP